MRLDVKKLELRKERARIGQVAPMKLLLDFQKPNPKYLRAPFLTMTITPHYHTRSFSKSKKVKREYINGNHLLPEIDDTLRR